MGPPLLLVIVVAAVVGVAEALVLGSSDTLAVVVEEGETAVKMLPKKRWKGELGVAAGDCCCGWEAAESARSREAVLVEEIIVVLIHKLKNC